MYGEQHFFSKIKKCVLCFKLGLTKENQAELQKLDL